MSDLVKRLRQIGEHDWRVSILGHASDTAMEAAAEIERLRLALTRIAAGDVKNIDPGPMGMRYGAGMAMQWKITANIARDALGLPLAT